MSKTLDIIMSLKDNVSPNLGKINSNLQTTSGKLNVMGKSITKLGGLLKTVFVGGAITKLAYDSIKAYEVQVKAEKGVQRALENTGKTALQAQQELKDYKTFASKQQDITAFGDETTLEVISGLISQGFGKKSIEDIVAMSQDIARHTGDSQENVVSAMSAYIKTGARAKILAKQYKLNADLLGKGKTESERLAEVWKAFSQSANKGASTEYLKTFEGRLTSIQGRLADMKEPVGDLINQLLGGNSEGLSGSAGALASLDELIVKATGDIQGIADKSKELGGGITGIGAACAYAHPILSALFVGLIGGKAVVATGSLVTGLTAVNATLGAGVATVLTYAGAIAGITAAATAASLAIAQLLGSIGGYLSASPELKASLQQDQELATGTWQNGGMSVAEWKKQLQGEANGTNYWTGGRVLVGEYGPELVDLPRGSSINTNAQTQRELSGGNNVTVNMTVQGNLIGNESFIDQVGDAISGRVTLALSNM